jgi:ABC-type lipoprotein release transport system permease subunit
MTLLRLLLNSFWHHRLGNLAVMLGVAVGCSVLTGALLVGDSMQGSLRSQSLRRLAWVSHSLVAPRFFREALAAKVSASSGSRVAPAILLQATASAGGRHARGVVVLGVDEAFFGGRPVEAPMLSAALARALGARPGEEVTLHLQKPGAMPREASLAKKELEPLDWVIKRPILLSDDDEGSAFNLRPELQAPRNAFVPLGELQKLLGLEGQVNVLLASGDGTAMQNALEASLELEDWGLTLQTPASRARALVQRYDTIQRDGKLAYSEWVFTRRKGKDLPRYAHILDEAVQPTNPKLRIVEDFERAFQRAHPYFSLESKSLLLPDQAASAALACAEALKIPAAPTLVNLCRLDVGEKRIAGVVAALDPTLPPPLGPFLPEGVKSLQPDEVILLDEAFPEKLPPRATVTLRYKPTEGSGASDEVATMTLAGVIPLAGAAVDPYLTPEFPGVTDRDDLGAWDLPFDDADWKKNISREYGDAYWKRARATPKAYIRLDVGQKMWRSPRFGSLTSIRLAGGDKEAALFREALKSRLRPADGGFLLDPVRESSLQASQGATPFGLLFLCFSFFIIASALLLVGLMVRLNIDRRAREVGLLLAEGLRVATVRWLFLGEGGLITLVGALAGMALALLYSRALLAFLAAIWPGESLRSFLTPHASAMSFVWGVTGSLLASLLTIYWVVRALGKVPPRALLAGRTRDELAEASASVGYRTFAVMGLSLAGGLAFLLSAPILGGHEAQAMGFFGSGALFLTAGLAACYAGLHGSRHLGVARKGWLGITLLGIRNAARSPARSMLTLGLIASAAFLIAAVESFRREAKPGDGSVKSADGGFALVGESDLPLVRSPDSDAGKAQILKGYEAHLARSHGQAPREEVERAERLLAEATLIGLRARQGDDASCLNLYRPRSPRLLGIPNALVTRGGFVFDAAAGGAREPWKLLQGEPGKGIPTFGESNTVAWMLQTGMGGLVEAQDERSQPVHLEIVGLLHDSVFQSALLISEEQFLRLYPSEEGYRYFLIAAPAGREEELRWILEAGLGDLGMEVSYTRDKLAAYLAVENTYLSTFQALGGLGLVLGSVGVAVVLLRSVWERRAELGLLRAVGWSKAQAAYLVMAENLFLLLGGLTVGALAAALSIAPRLATGQAALPLANLAFLYAGALGVGMLACLGAVWGSLAASPVAALRRE